MAPKTLDEHIVITPDIAFGKPRIAGHRITVLDIVVWHEQMGMGANEIAAEYQIALSDIHAALAYYFDHREEIDRQIKEDHDFIEEMRKRHRSPLQGKLAEIRARDARHD